jgi:outer membrane protein TolC
MSLPAPASIVVIALLFFTTAARAQPVTLAEAIRQAEASGPSVAAKDLAFDSARYRYNASLAELGPRLNLSADYQRWNSPINFAFDLPKELKDALGLQDFKPTQSVVRQQDTYSASVNVVQPITPLISLGLVSQLQKLNVDQAQMAAVAERRRTRLAVIDSFYGVLKLRRIVATMAGLEKAAAIHLEHAERYEAVGLLKRDDVLRIRVRLDSLRQELDLVRAGADVQCSHLALLMGLPVQASLDPVEGEDPPAIPEALDVCIADAIQHRVELKQARIAIGMAETARSLKIASWIPTLTGIFSYSQTTPSEFSRSTSWFAGVSAQWTPWDWGKTFLESRAAHSDVLAARQTVAQAEDLIPLEVKANWLAAQTAKNGIPRAIVSVEQARENLRIQFERARQNLNTTADVLDAQALLLQAEAESTGAEYLWRVAREKLYDSMGR